MSERDWTPVLKAVNEDAELSDGAHRLYCVLLGYCWRGGDVCWPSQTRLAAQLKRSEPTVRARLQELERVGYITQHVRAGRSTEYELHRQAPYTPQDSLGGPPQDPYDEEEARKKKQTPRFEEGAEVVQLRRAAAS